MPPQLTFDWTPPAPLQQHADAEDPAAGSSIVLDPPTERAVTELMARLLIAVVRALVEDHDDR